MDVVLVRPVTKKQTECTMCSRTRDLPEATIWEVRSRDQYRRFVFGLCNFCASELITQISNLRAQNAQTEA